MAIMDRLIMHLRFEEGFYKEPYFDTKKIKTIGTGLNLEEAWPEEWLEFLGVEDEDDITHITKEQDRQIVIWHLEHSVEDLEELFADVWDDISDLRQEMLIAMRFQLGMPKFKKFRKLIAAVKDLDWDEAYAQILDSNAAREDAPARFNRIAQAVKTNNEAYLKLEKLFDEDEDGDEGEEEENSKWSPNKSVINKDSYNSVDISGKTDSESIKELYNVSVDTNNVLRSILGSLNNMNSKK